MGCFYFVRDGGGGNRNHASIGFTDSPHGRAAGRGIIHHRLFPCGHGVKLYHAHLCGWAACDLAEEHREALPEGLVYLGSAIDLSVVDFWFCVARHAPASSAQVSPHREIHAETGEGKSDKRQRAANDFSRLLGDAIRSLCDVRMDCSWCWKYRPRVDFPKGTTLSAKLLLGGHDDCDHRLWRCDTCNADTDDFYHFDRSHWGGLVWLCHRYFCEFDCELGFRAEKVFGANG